MRKRILMSLALIAVAGAAAYVAATGAFFQDVETSTDNLFQAGAIDLLVDNESYVTNGLGELVASSNTTWLIPEDLDDHLFFNFTDLKPGDIGEDTISLHVNNNPAWLCAAAQITDDSDVDYTEPELEDDLTVDENNPEGTDGELAENLNFVFWADDGDNVLEDDEDDSIFVQGPASALNQVGVVTLADSDSNIWTQQADSPVAGDETVYIGKAWCFGTLTPNPLANGQDYDPITDGTGFTCSGAGDANNAAQTDRVMGDIQFYAVQSRNNANFLCANDYQPEFPVRPQATAGTGWSPVDLENDGKDWFAKARNNNGGFEYAVGTDDQSAAGQDTADTTWVEGVDNHFTLEYNSSTDLATLTIVGHGSVSFTVDDLDYTRIGINVKSPGPDTTEVKNLVLNSSSISPDSIDTSGGSPSNLTIVGDFSGGFTLEGDFVFNELSGAVQENPAVQFSIDND